MKIYLTIATENNGQTYSQSRPGGLASKIPSKDQAETLVLSADSLEEALWKVLANTATAFLAAEGKTPDSETRSKIDRAVGALQKECS